MVTAYTPQHDDPFAGGSKTPSLSWKDLPIGSAFTLLVLEPAKLLQSRDYRTNDPDYWDKETKQNPKMSAVINVRVLNGPHSVGEDRSIWAQKPSDLFVAIAGAQQTAKNKIATGGTLHLRFAGETPHSDPKNNPIKNYQAKYEPPTTSDAFGAEAPVTPPRYAQPAQPVPSAAPVGWPQRPLDVQPTMERQPGNPNVASKLRW